MSRIIGIIAAGLLVLWPLFAVAQDTPQNADDPAAPRAETGGAQTLEDILRRQRGEEVEPDLGGVPGGVSVNTPGVTGPLGTLGGASDPELWRGMKEGTVSISTTARTPGATLLMQETGIEWLQFREGKLRTYGAFFLLAVLGVLALFYILRGRVRIEAGRAGTTIERFKFIERFGHWLIAGSFVVLGVTGLWSLFGRHDLIPLIGREAYATSALWSKWVHDNVSWAFMLGLAMVFVMWVLHNIPNRHDLVWLVKGGGMFSKNSHPPAKKFNAGQKIIFWSVIILGVSISASGLALLFPFEFSMFELTFQKLRGVGITELPFYGALPETLTPHAEMQTAQTWHAVIAFLFIGIVFAHIYIGTVGMEGAYDAMGSGEVDLNWAKEHHNLWVEEVHNKSSPAPRDATPAE